MVGLGGVALFLDSMRLVLLLCQRHSAVIPSFMIPFSIIQLSVVLDNL